MKAAFTGTLTWGMVVVGLKAYPVISEGDAKIRWVHRPCLTPVSEARRCNACNLVGIPDGQRVRAVETGGRWITIEDSEFQQVMPEPETGRPITVQAMAKLAELNPLWLEKAYYLAPEAQAGRAYSLLHRVLQTEQAGAIVTFISYSRPRLGVIYAGAQGLLLRLLHYSESVRDWKAYGVELGAVVLKPDEIRMAQTFVRRQVRPFTHKTFKNEYHERLQGLIEDKLKGKVPTPPPAVPVAAKILDLTAALKASLDAVAARRGARAKEPKKAAKRKAARR